MSWASRLATGFFEGATAQLPLLAQNLERRDREKRQDEREDKRQLEATIRQRFQAGDQDGAIAEANAKGMADLANQLAGIKQGVTVASYKGNIADAESSTALAQTALTTAQTPEDLTKPLQQSALAQETALQQSAPDILSQLQPGQADTAAQAFGAAYETEFDLTRRQQQLGRLPMLKAQAESEPDVSPEIERQLREIVPDTADVILSSIKADKKKDKERFYTQFLDNPGTAAMAAKELAKMGGDPAMVDFGLAVAAEAAGDEQQALINQYLRIDDYENAATLAETSGKKEQANSIRKFAQKQERELARKSKETYQTELRKYLEDERNYYPKDEDGRADFTKPAYPKSKLIETFNANWNASEQEARKMFAEEEQVGGEDIPGMLNLLKREMSQVAGDERRAKAAFHAANIQEDVQSGALSREGGMALLNAIAADSSLADVRDVFGVGAPGAVPPMDSAALAPTVTPVFTPPGGSISPPATPTPVFREPQGNALAFRAAASDTTPLFPADTTGNPTPLIPPIIPPRGPFRVTPQSPLLPSGPTGTTPSTNQPLGIGGRGGQPLLNMPGSGPTMRMPASIEETNRVAAPVTSRGGVQTETVRRMLGIPLKEAPKLLTGKASPGEAIIRGRSYTPRVEGKLILTAKQAAMAKTASGILGVAPQAISILRAIVEAKAELGREPDLNEVIRMYLNGSPYPEGMI